ncbi:purine-nucleoside phosphorylase [Sporohalobacter salinus]|uniref:purine-nucleoside phosphorylase n=1 Tax=Sporohalobacter salinus TaxID=1494606 RepID=UPI001961EB92|nr:purine-nucleoside phosphorylase [Sporohalobacter salinus]MBM7623588.1 purine-nucleoside phosphorylase [Sporohalobacter salinus]
MERIKVEESVEYLVNLIDIEPEIALILGSGLGELAEEIKESTVISYSEIPNFPVSTVKGHAGQLVSGELKGKRVIAMQGRFHYYEGYDIEKVTFPVRVMKFLGADKLIITNSAGGVNRNYNVGDLMIINDHINFMGTNPLIGPNEEEFGPRFLDMSEPYSSNLITAAENAAKEIGINVRKGVYLATTGPNYETPAEVRCMARLGADAVGMSTVPEVIVANHMNCDVLGISCITNMAAGILSESLDHKEVIETTNRVKDDFIDLITKILELI